MNRRTYLLAAGTGAIATVAGCLDEMGVEDDESGGDDGDDDGTGTEAEGEDDGTEDDHPALAVVDAYMDAATDDDPEAVSQYIHTYHPFDPVEMAAEAEADEDTEFSYEPAAYDDYDREMLDEGFETDDVHEIPHVEFWFEEREVTLEEILEGEETVLVEATTETTEDGDTETEPEQFVMLTDDGEWRVFLPYEEPPEVPDDDPVDDEAYRIVDDVAFDAETEMATIHLSGAGDVEADELVAYSATLSDESSVWSDESDTLPSLESFTVGFDLEGDEIVVALRGAADAEDELVVYRETYDPDDE